MAKLNNKIFYKRKIADLLYDKKYVNHFSEIKLTQQTEIDPIIYKGPGSLYQDDSGNLILKVYHVYSRKKPQRFHDRKVNIGEFVGKEHYYKLKAIDMSGEEWFAKDVWVPENITIPSTGTVLEVPLDEIELFKKATKAPNYNYELMALGKFNTPPSEFIEYPNGSMSRSKHSIVFDSIEITTISEDNRLFVQIAGKTQDYDEGLFDIIIESIGVAIGRKISPSTINVTGLGATILKICSIKSNNDRELNQAIPTNMPSDGKNFSDFIIRYVTMLKMPWSTFYMLWYKIYSSTSSNLENIALIQSTAIEGVLKGYFPEYGSPNTIEFDSIVFAVKIINSSILDDKMKERILGSINTMKNQNPRRALIELKKRGYITGKMERAWITQRQSLAHGKIISAGGLAEMQKVLDDSNTVLALFYRLLFLYIGYTELFIDYSSAKWPKISM